MQLNEKDIRTDVYSSGVNCSVIVSLTHLPTGCRVYKEGKSRPLLREELLPELGKKVAEVAIIDCRTAAEINLEQCLSRMERVKKE